MTIERYSRAASETTPGLIAGRLTRSVLACASRRHCNCAEDRAMEIIRAGTRPARLYAGSVCTWTTVTRFPLPSELLFCATAGPASRQVRASWLVQCPNSVRRNSECARAMFQPIEMAEKDYEPTYVFRASCSDYRVFRPALVRSCNGFPCCCDGNSCSGQSGRPLPPDVPKNARPAETLPNRLSLCWRASRRWPTVCHVEQTRQIGNRNDARGSARVLEFSQSREAEHWTQRLIASSKTL